MFGNGINPNWHADPYAAAAILRHVSWSAVELGDPLDNSTRIAK
jgi:hypothetical protein